MKAALLFVLEGLLFCLYGIIISVTAIWILDYMIDRRFIMKRQGETFTRRPVNQSYAVH